MNLFTSLTRTRTAGNFTLIDSVSTSFLSRGMASLIHPMSPRIFSLLRKLFCFSRFKPRRLDCRAETATAGSDVGQSGRPIFDDFFQHLWPYIGNNTANVVV
ncbi:hypothetical protein TNCV_4601651 [Trichonephila clavipes]|nr:hypothetical protein TNCV_4601651 [Trichonephila clavipes]